MTKGNNNLSTFLTLGTDNFLSGMFLSVIFVHIVVRIAEKSVRYQLPLHRYRHTNLCKAISPSLSDLVTFVDNNKMTQYSIILYISGHTKLVNHIMSEIDA